MPHRSQVFKTRVSSKKNFPPIVAFLSLTVTFLSLIAVFSCQKKKFINTRFREPYSGVFKPYSDVLNPYNVVFLQFMETESLKLDFHVDFFPHQTLPLTNRDLKT